MLALVFQDVGNAIVSSHMGRVRCKLLALPLEPASRRAYDLQEDNQWGGVRLAAAVLQAAAHAASSRRGR